MSEQVITRDRLSQAMYDTVALGNHLGMPHDMADTSLGHFLSLYYCLFLTGKDVDLHKLSRMLGWAQACVVLATSATMDDMRKINMWRFHPRLPQKWRASGTTGVFLGDRMDLWCAPSTLTDLQAQGSIEAAVPSLSGWPSDYQRKPPKHQLHGWPLYTHALVPMIGEEFNQEWRVRT